LQPKLFVRGNQNLVNSLHHYFLFLVSELQPWCGRNQNYLIVTLHHKGFFGSLGLQLGCGLVATKNLGHSSADQNLVDTFPPWFLVTTL